MPLTLSIQTDDGRMRTVRVAIAATASQLIMVPVPGVRDVAEMVADPRAELLGTVTLLRAMP
jgi:hypothetical protein